MKQLRDARASAGRRLVLACALAVLAAPAAAAQNEIVERAVRSGLNFAGPLTVRLDWKLAVPPRDPTPVRELLARKGFTVTWSVTTFGVQGRQEQRVVAERAGAIAPAELSALIDQVAAMTGGAGSVSWAISQESR